MFYHLSLTPSSRYCNIIDRYCKQYLNQGDCPPKHGRYAITFTQTIQQKDIPKSLFGPLKSVRLLLICLLQLSLIGLLFFRLNTGLKPSWFRRPRGQKLPVAWWCWTSASFTFGIGKRPASKGHKLFTPHFTSLLSTQTQSSLKSLQFGSIVAGWQQPIGFS